MMYEYLYYVQVWIKSRLLDCWALVDSMNRTEWFVLLISVTVLGFMLMRGSGSRQNC